MTKGQNLKQADCPPNGVVKYVEKKGAYISGIPTRDMTPDEWNDITEEVRRMALTIKMYEINKINSKEGE
jgi:hypothetical protein